MSIAVDSSQGALTRFTDVLRSHPSNLPSFLAEPACHQLQHDAVLQTVIKHLSLLDCCTLWQLHSHHIARIEAVIQLCPPRSAAAASFAQLLLDDPREGADKLNAAFCSSPFSNLTLALLRLSAQPASAFPLYPLAPSAASALLSSLFFCSHPHSQSIRQHISILLLLVRPPALRQQLLSALLLKCLSSGGASTDANASSLTSMELTSVLSFLCQRMSAFTLLHSYTSALTTTAASSSSSSSAYGSLTAHRTLLNLFISPRQFTPAIGQQLFDFFAVSLSAAVTQRHSALFRLVLQLARHCITCLQASGSAAATGRGSDGVWQLARDYSAWFDQQLEWVTAARDEADGKGGGAGVGRSGTKRKRKGKYVLKRKGDGAAQDEGDGEEDEWDEQADEGAEMEDEESIESAAVRRQRKAQQDARRKERQQQEEDDAQADKRRRVRQQEEAAERQERVRFVLSCLFDSLASDETAVVTHYLHVVGKRWKSEGLLSDAEADRYCRCARVKIAGGSWTAEVTGDAIVLDASQ